MPWPADAGSLAVAKPVHPDPRRILERAKQTGEYFAAGADHAPPRARRSSAPKEESRRRSGRLPRDRRTGRGAARRGAARMFPRSPGSRRPGRTRPERRRTAQPRESRRPAARGQPRVATIRRSTRSSTMPSNAATVSSMSSCGVGGARHAPVVGHELHPPRPEPRLERGDEVLRHALEHRRVAWCGAPIDRRPAPIAGPRGRCGTRSSRRRRSPRRPRASSTASMPALQTIGHRVGVALRLAVRGQLEACPARGGRTAAPR